MLPRCHINQSSFVFETFILALFETRAPDSNFSHAPPWQVYCMIGSVVFCTVFGTCILPVLKEWNVRADTVGRLLGAAMFSNVDSQSKFPVHSFGHDRVVETCGYPVYCNCNVKELRSMHASTQSRPHASCRPPNKDRERTSSQIDCHITVTAVTWRNELQDPIVFRGKELLPRNFWSLDLFNSYKAISDPKFELRIFTFQSPLQTFFVVWRSAIDVVVVESPPASVVVVVKIEGFCFFDCAW
jgi:hypothetical protein